MFETGYCEKWKLLLFLRMYPLSKFQPPKQKWWISIRILLLILWAFDWHSDGRHQVYENREERVWLSRRWNMKRTFWDHFQTIRSENQSSRGPVFETKHPLQKYVSDLYLEGRNKSVFYENLEFEVWKTSKMLAFLGISRLPKNQPT